MEHGRTIETNGKRVYTIYERYVQCFEQGLMGKVFLFGFHVPSDEDAVMLGDDLRTDCGKVS